MTPSQIVSAANRGGIATKDINLPVILRNKVIPDFFQKVGNLGWTRKTTSFSTVVSTRGPYDLAEDFYFMEGLYLPVTGTTPPSYKGKPLKYIGEDMDLIARAEEATINAKPSGWYLSTAGAFGGWRSLMFDVPPDAVYKARYIYQYDIVFRADQDDPDLNAYIPERHNWTLVEGLRAEIFLDRFGSEDPRFGQVKQSYLELVAQAAERKELARRNWAVFAR